MIQTAKKNSVLTRTYFPPVPTFAVIVIKINFQGRKLTLEEFWSEELSLLPGRKLEKEEEVVEEDVLDSEEDVLGSEEVVLVASMVEASMPPSIKIPGFNP